MSLIFIIIFIFFFVGTLVFLVFVISKYVRNENCKPISFEYNKSCESKVSTTKIKREDI